MVWINDDGLRVRFGAELAETAKSGTASENQPVSRQMISKIEPLSDGFPANGSPEFLSEPTAAMPEGALIRSATLIVLETFTSAGAPTLDLGLKDQDGVEIDHDGYAAAIALGALTQGAEIAGAGALIGTVTAANGYASINIGGGADYTGGKALLVVDYILPQ